MRCSFVKRVVRALVVGTEGGDGALFESGFSENAAPDEIALLYSELDFPGHGVKVPYERALGL